MASKGWKFGEWGHSSKAKLMHWIGGRGPFLDFQPRELIFCTFFGHKLWNILVNWYLFYRVQNSFCEKLKLKLKIMNKHLIIWFWYPQMIWELNLEWWAAIPVQCLLSVFGSEKRLFSFLYKFTKRKNSWFQSLGFCCLRLLLIFERYWL